ncbi:cytochrome c oxidase assembly protein [Rhodococcus sp. IEGM 1408]|uniref:cytochrome c oxidase assembly protein n=1 Tax=Rhodococcus sp. IEGM 1408 TaxID=3082220 RepID=UPI002954AFD6|nr:cytochrome c oxidase assembly protein [Rhodococcus sp. IEGM 1408]MDV7999945.1 cytochrome c oxidase assembly protein [Rhodococcus sp. IEGM 1408]
MHLQHGPHGTESWWVPETIGAALLVLALAAYVVGVHRHSDRDRGPWPRHRIALWAAGLSCVGAAWLGPLAEAARTDFTAHMAGHLLLGMLGPLLLVCAAPVTLALRTLQLHHARVLSRVLRSPFARAVTHPVVATVLNVGGVWVLYGTGLYALMHQSMALHVLVHAHVLLAGVAFTVAIVGPDPNPHRAGFGTRAAVLVVFIAAHSILGRWLYGHPPAGVDPADARAGAQLMFYGGELIDLALLTLLFAGWYPGTRRQRRPRVPAHASTTPRPGETLRG